MYKYIFFDFNGTIIDDIDLCLDLLNEILRKQNKPLVGKKKYKEIIKNHPAKIKTSILYIPVKIIALLRRR